MLQNLQQAPHTEAIHPSNPILAAQNIRTPEPISPDEITSELKGVQFPLSQFNPWQATLLTDRAIHAHLALLHQAVGAGAPYPRDQPDTNPDWVPSTVNKAWHLAQRINPSSPNQHLAWRSAEQIFRFGMAHNRSTYFTYPYHALLFSWEPFTTGTLAIYAREGAFLCQRFHPEETTYHLTAYYTGSFLYHVIQDNNPTVLHPVIKPYLQKLAQWARENGADTLFNKRLQRQRDTEADPFTILQNNLWMAAYAAYTQDPSPLIELTLEASTQIQESQLIQMGQKLLTIV